MSFNYYATIPIILNSNKNNQNNGGKERIKTCFYCKNSKSCGGDVPLEYYCKYLKKIIDNPFKICEYHNKPLLLCSRCKNLKLNKIFNMDSGKEKYVFICKYSNKIINNFDKNVQNLMYECEYYNKNKPKEKKIKEYNSNKIKYIDRIFKLFSLK